jgi:hypothetical protein
LLVDGRVGQQAPASHNGRQPIHMTDVINLGVYRHGHDYKLRT